MSTTDCSSLYKLCNSLSVDIPAIQSLLSSSSPSTRTQLLSYQDSDGQTPLHVACENGHHQIVEMLLTAGANIAAQDNYGQTPLHVAHQNGNHQVVELLLSAGANQETPDDNVSYSRGGEIDDSCESDGGDSWAGGDDSWGYFGGDGNKYPRISEKQNAKMATSTPESTTG